MNLNSLAGRYFIIADAERIMLNGCEGCAVKFHDKGRHKYLWHAEGCPNVSCEHSRFYTSIDFKILEELDKEMMEILYG